MRDHVRRQRDQRRTGHSRGATIGAKQDRICQQHERNAEECDGTGPRDANGIGISAHVECRRRGHREEDRQRRDAIPRQPAEIAVMVDAEPVRRYAVSSDVPLVLAANQPACTAKTRASAANSGDHVRKIACASSAGDDMDQRRALALFHRDCHRLSLLRTATPAFDPSNPVRKSNRRHATGHQNDADERPLTPCSMQKEHIRRK